MPIISVVQNPTVATEEDLQLDIFVEPQVWEGLFDALEVWRSRVGPEGPYEPLTGTGWLPARIPAGAGDPPTPAQTGPSVVLVGNTVSFRVNEMSDFTVTFTGTDPLNFGQAATQITQQGLRLVRAYVLGNVLAVQTAQPGSGAILRVTGGNAAPLLGLPTQEPASVAFGLDARIPLVDGQVQYLYTDHNGSPEFWYKTRFYSNNLNTTSVFSLPFSGKSVSTLTTASLVRATVDLVDNFGVALAHRAILLAPKFSGAAMEGKTLVDGKAEKLTDVHGHAEWMLVRGQPFTVAIAGTDLVRDFVSPNNPTVVSFSMLDPAIGKNDVFKVQVPNINYANRTTL